MSRLVASLKSRRRRGCHATTRLHGVGIRIVTTNEVKEVLLWCAALNYTILFVWFGVFVFAHDWLYGMHRRWFNLSIETFDAIHYGALSVYKIGMILLNLVPLVALCLQ
jgi:hypothetical protein